MKIEKTNITAGASAGNMNSFNTMQDAITYVAKNADLRLAGSTWYITHSVKIDGVWTNVSKMTSHSATDCGTILKARRHLGDITRTLSS